MSIKEFFNSKDFARIQKGLKKVFETGEWRLKADIIMKNGKSIPYIFEAYKLEYDKSLVCQEVHIVQLVLPRKLGKIQPV